MNTHRRNRFIKLRTITWLLAIISITILISSITGVHSATDQESIENEQHTDSRLTGKILELKSIDVHDDIDTYFQPTFDRYNFEQPSIESYRVANSQNVAIPTLISDSNTELLEHDKRDASWFFDLSQTLPMDGSGTVTEEESTESTDTTTTPSTIDSTTTIQTTTDVPLISTASTTTTTSTSTSTTTTTRPQICTWTNWVPLSNCTPSCGIAYRLEVRSCIDFTIGQSCHSDLCGGGNAIQNTSCTYSPLCPTLPIIPQPSIRDPKVRIIPYLLPDAMYFFEQTYRRIWISNKGYITFGTPFYSRTMTTSTFGQISQQAIAAPFWTDLLYDNRTSVMTINWFSSTNASESDVQMYSEIIQSAINSACPTTHCSSRFAAARVVRIHWQNLVYELTNVSQSMNISFAAYLINTYEYASYYSQPVLRSYIAYDYSELPDRLSSIRPFVGYRGKREMMKVFNDPSYQRNAPFLTYSDKTRRRQSFYAGGRFLSDCEVTHLQQTHFNILNPAENLNDVVNNPRFPCPCTLAQAQIDRRFGRLFSETAYETSQHVICYGPMTNNWIRFRWTTKLLRSQTCCYNRVTRDLITSGYLAGSVLSNVCSLLDQCCAPSRQDGIPNWQRCRLYYQLHPASSCTGYRAPAIVSGVGDPHVNTIDNGRYTCHIQGLYVFAQTTDAARVRAENNTASNISDVNLIYPDDLFRIYVRSVMVSPVLSYIERTQGYGSIFTSYTIITDSVSFVISNNNGKFGCTINNDTALTDDLVNNLNYDYISSVNDTDQYTYRIMQIPVTVSNLTVPQLIISLWSGMSIECQIVIENLECITTLPEKYRTFIEGLAGNFNGEPNDDLIDRRTNQTLSISSASNSGPLSSDMDVLNACHSWKLSDDGDQDDRIPIMPRNFVNWYYNNASDFLAILNPSLSKTMVEQICSGRFECVHDYLIRINSFTSQETDSIIQSTENSRNILAETQPTIDIVLPIQITLPIDESNRNYTLLFNITGWNVSDILFMAYTNESSYNVSFNDSFITIPIPNNILDFVDVLLTVNFGTNSTWQKYFDIIVCLCTNDGTCDFQETTHITSHYQIASCDCPPQFDGDLCEYNYSACASPSACTLHWNNQTTCISLSPTEQQLQNRSYYCNGTCINGYHSTDDYTCEDVDECQSDPSICRHGPCINLPGSFTCNCTSGYRFHNQTCVDINECNEPNIDGSFSRRCPNDVDVCVNNDGSYECECSAIFNTTGTCTYNASLCLNDTCMDNESGLILCLHGTVNVNNQCVPWCDSTCAGFCDQINDTYQCNCMKYVGYELSNDGQRCVECRDLSYGYGCRETCECNHGVCNRNATHVNESCMCDVGYRAPNCVQLIDACGSASKCNNMTEDCTTDAQNGSAICVCKNGYERNATSDVCIDVDECVQQADNCDGESSKCVNTVGSYVCSCKDGYKNMNGSCVDIDECNAALTSCADYNNTYCVNTAGSWECRCAPGYSLGGNYEHQFENARNTSDLCLATIYSSFCENGCKEPASCSSATGRCTCPINALQLAVSSDPTRETCRCLDHPFVYYNETECVNVSGQTWILLHMKFKKSVRSVLIKDSALISLENQISDILNNISISCDASCMDVFDTQDVLLPDLQLLVTLNVTMNSTDRVEFANRLFSNDIAYNESYVLVLAQIIADTATRIPENYTNVTSLTTTTLSISTQIVTEELITNTEVMFSTTFQTTEGGEETKTSKTEISTEVTKEATGTTSYMSETVIADNTSTLFTLYDTVTSSSAAYVTSEIHMTDMASYSTLNGTSQTASDIAETIRDVTTATGSTDTKTTEGISEGPSSITHTNKPVPTSADIAYSATTYESITNMVSNSSTIEIISSTMITPIGTETPAIISTDTSSRTAVDISETTNSIITPPTSIPSVFSDASTITNTDTIVTLVTTTTMISDTAIYTNETKTTFDVSDETSFTIIPTSSLPITLSTTSTSEIITPISTDTVTPIIMTTTIENTNFTHLSTETSEIANTSPGTTEYVTISEGTETKISTTNTNLPPTIETNETKPTIYTTVQPSPILTTTTNSMMTEISVSTTSTTTIDTLISGSTSVDTTSSSDALPTTPSTTANPLITSISESASVDITSSSDTTPTTTTNAGVTSNVSTINTDFSTVSSAITSITTDIEGLTNYSITTSFSASTDITIPTTMLTNTAVHNITTINYTTTSTQTTTPHQRRQQPQSQLLLRRLVRKVT
ncbi:hypothetical protein I4U23_018479 [Adineta vaga]|nr:hypothetical protein I4U23_018479 [Adineta vaga]